MSTPRRLFIVYLSVGAVICCFGADITHGMFRYHDSAVAISSKPRHFAEWLIRSKI